MITREKDCTYTPKEVAEDKWGYEIDYKDLSELSKDSPWILIKKLFLYSSICLIIAFYERKKTFIETRQGFYEVKLLLIHEIFTN